MRLNRLLLQWSGPQVVGGGVSVLHFEGAEGAVPDVAAIASACGILAAVIPTGVVITVPDSGDVIEDTTGDLVDVWSGTGGANVPGTAPSSCAAGVGACVTWNTGGIVNGRRLRGRTFVVPLTVNAYDLNGTITASSLDVVQDFADDVQASGGLAVWHRPTTSGSSDGTSYGVLSNAVRDKVAILTSRRD